MHSEVSQKTSLITILSSDHGRLRREQRDIDKRDLQKALKYGRKKPAWGNRWRVEHDGITFITDSTWRQEITAFPSPLPKMEIDKKMEVEHGKVKHLLTQKPELATSHTVLVIDDSGSMVDKKNDIHLYRDSQNAAFSMTALEFVAEQIFNQTAVNSDLVSLIKFNKSPTVEIEREPIGWFLYNKILEHRNYDKFEDRQISPLIDQAQAGSNYIPALMSAMDLLEIGYHENCALSLFFFSDGLPTDDKMYGVSKSRSTKKMCEKLSSMAQKFGKRLTVTIVGLGDVSDDFHVLKYMAAAANLNGAKSNFQFCNKTANSISSAITSLISSTTQTRTALQDVRESRLTSRIDLRAEREAVQKFDWRYFHILDHFVYDPQQNHVSHCSTLPSAATLSYHPEHTLQHHPPPFLAINQNYVGKGAERVAFRCRLSCTSDVRGFAFDAMIAKETKDVERVQERLGFHHEFLRTQDLASYLASQFNRRLRGLPQFDSQKTPQIKFLRCSILRIRDPSWPSGCRDVLVEKMLDNNRFPWTKWNDNDGMVNGVRKHLPLDVDFELRQLEKEREVGGLGAIAEEDADDESMEESSRGYDEKEDPTDYLQAFTHFTYLYTDRRVMVCDLQGVYNTEMTPSTFELTDPAIHYRSTVGRRMVYGRTDKGEAGMRAFFKSHKCTGICKVLRLSGKNKEWKTDWHRHSQLNTRIPYHTFRNMLP